MTIFGDTSYLNYEDLNAIEDKIVELNNLGGGSVEYTRKTWELNEFPYVEDIDNIEEGISRLITTYSSYDDLPFQPKKTWKKEDGTYEPTAFSVKDINRWINNLNLLEGIL